MPVSAYLEARDGERPIGVYGLLDSRHNLQYVGYSRNMVLSIKVRAPLHSCRPVGHDTVLPLRHLCCACWSRRSRRAQSFLAPLCAPPHCVLQHKVFSVVAIDTSGQWHIALLVTYRMARYPSSSLRNSWQLTQCFVRRSGAVESAARISIVSRVVHGTSRHGPAERRCSLQGHLDRVGEERCAFVRAMVFANKAMANRSNLAREAQNWIDAEGTTPPGNGAHPTMLACVYSIFGGLLSRL